MSKVINSTIFNYLEPTSVGSILDNWIKYLEGHTRRTRLSSSIVFNIPELAIFHLLILRGNLDMVGLFDLVILKRFPDGINREWQTCMGRNNTNMEQLQTNRINIRGGLTTEKILEAVKQFGIQWQIKFDIDFSKQQWGKPDLVRLGFPTKKFKKELFNFKFA